MKLLRLVSFLVVAAIAVFALPVALGEEGLVNPTRSMPDTVERGGTFNVTVNFTAPADKFTAISLTDLFPTGWNVGKAQCQPSASATASGNLTQVLWVGGESGYDNGTNFTALYKVTVPDCNASLGNYSFSGNLGYFIAGSDQYFEEITGGCPVELVSPSIVPTPASIDFWAVYNGTNPENQTLELRSSTRCWLNWSLTDDANYTGHDWLSGNPPNGSCNYTEHSFAVLSVNTSGMPVRDYSANITINATEANNSPQTIPVTLHIRETGTLKGQVSFTGRGTNNSRWIESFDVRAFPAGNLTKQKWAAFQPGNLANQVWADTGTTNNTGVFIVPDVFVETYDIAIKNWTCLSEVVTNVTLTAGETTPPVPFGTTREGDANNNDVINIMDLVVACDAYGSNPESPNWDPNCDFNRNDLVNIMDLVAACDYYGQKGALSPY